MIIVEVPQIVYYDGYKVIPSHPVTCPSCKDGFAMWRYGFRLRKVKDFQGRSYQINLQRYYCPKCKKIFVILPSFLIPYKQYDRETIFKIQNGLTLGCGASYQSIYLWTRFLHSL